MHENPMKIAIVILFFLYFLFLVDAYEYKKKMNESEPSTQLPSLICLILANIATIAISILGIACAVKKPSLISLVSLSISQ